MAKRSRSIAPGLRLGSGAFTVPSSFISHGSAAAVLVKTLSTVNARMGERSMVPPMGGMMPRNRFRYGSHRVASGYTICRGGFGNLRMDETFMCTGELRKSERSWRAKSAGSRWSSRDLSNAMVGFPTSRLMAPNATHQVRISRPMRSVL